jgi:hypothetical protein
MTASCESFDRQDASPRHVDWHEYRAPNDSMITSADHASIRTDNL